MMTTQNTNCPNNLWKTVTFELDMDNIPLSFRLVPAPTHERELNAHSVVGQALLTARPGDEIVAQAPGGPVSIYVHSIIDQEVCTQ
jgi:transcription elongation GreA/GreB family factor